MKSCHRNCSFYNANVGPRGMNFAAVETAAPCLHENEG
jgi:hypothetical protein